MKKVFEDIIASNDMQAIKNCVAIMADCCEVGMNDSVMLDVMKQVQGEIGACHYKRRDGRYASLSHWSTSY